MFKPYHRRFLKVKIKSLSAESKIIRLEEQKCFDSGLYFELYHHRVVHIREHARVNFIAYAYLRGRTLQSFEGKTSVPLYIMNRALKVVKKFGTLEAAEGFNDWSRTPIDNV